VQGIIGKSDSVAVVVSGSGLKDVRRAIEAAGAPLKVPPTMEAVRAALLRMN